MMQKLLERLRGAIRQFLGLNALAVLPGDQAYQHIGERLLRMHRIFGDPSRVTMGQDVVLNDALINTSSGTVVLEDHAFCGHGVCLLTGHHDYAKTGYERQSAVPQQGRNIVVGSGAWIGSNATVIGPCTIGRDAVIAAGAVVTGPVEAGWVYGGVPARPIKRIPLPAASASASASTLSSAAGEPSA